MRAGRRWLRRRRPLHSRPRPRRSRHRPVPNRQSQRGKTRHRRTLLSRPELLAPAQRLPPARRRRSPVRLPRVHRSGLAVAPRKLIRRLRVMHRRPGAARPEWSPPRLVVRSRRPFRNPGPEDPSEMTGNHLPSFPGSPAVLGRSRLWRARRPIERKPNQRLAGTRPAWHREWPAPRHPRLALQVRNYRRLARLKRT